jgi:hypothetical protein
MKDLIKYLVDRQEVLEAYNPHEHEWEYPVDDIENNILSSMLYYIDEEGASHPNPLKISVLLEMLSTLTKKIALMTGEKFEGQQDSLIQYIAGLEQGMERFRELRVVSPENQIQKMGNAKIQIMYKDRKYRRDCAKQFLEQLQTSDF